MIGEIPTVQRVVGAACRFPSVYLGLLLAGILVDHVNVIDGRETPSASTPLVRDVWLKAPFPALPLGRVAGTLGRRHQDLLAAVSPTIGGALPSDTEFYAPAQTAV